MSKPGRVWVTGASGMLGREVLAELARRGLEAIGTDLEVDIADPVAVRAQLTAIGATCIFNCAAYTRVDDAEREPALARRVNAEGPEILGRAALAQGAALVHISTDYVFAGDASEPYREEMPTQPLGVYGQTKWEGEARLLALAPALTLYLVRTSWLFGPGGKNFVATMLDLLAAREELRVVHDQRGRPTYAPDLAAAALDLAGLGDGLSPHTPGLYHYANTGETTWHELTCRILDRARARGRSVATRVVHAVTTAEFPRPAPRPAYSVLDTGKLQATLGAAPPHWHDALERYLDAIDRGRSPSAMDPSPAQR